MMYISGICLMGINEFLTGKQVMKRTNKTMFYTMRILRNGYTLFVLIFIIAAFLCGCQSGFNQPTESMALIETTQAADVEKVTYKTLCALLDEANTFLLENETIKIPVNFYTETFVRKQHLEEDDTVKRDGADFSFNCPMSKDKQLQLRYLIFLSFLTKDYEEYIQWTDYNADPNRGRPIAYLLCLSTDYKKLGYSTITEYVDAGRPLQSETMLFSISFSSMYIALYYKEGEYDISYSVYSENSPCLYYETAKEPMGIGGPQYPGYTGDGIPPC